MNSSSRLFDANFASDDTPGSMSSDNSFTAVLCNISGGQTTTETRLTSKVHFTFSEGVEVRCDDSVGRNTSSLQKASKYTMTQCLCYCNVVPTIAGFPSPPINLHYTSTDSVDVKLDWDPPLNDGGVAITNYHIVVNMSQQVVSTDTTTRIPQDNTS